MARVRIDDLAVEQALSGEQMRKLAGGGHGVIIGWGHHGHPWGCTCPMCHGHYGGYYRPHVVYGTCWCGRFHGYYRPLPRYPYYPYFGRGGIYVRGRGFGFGIRF